MQNQKVKVNGISNREDYLCITTEKDSNHYPFLFNLLKHSGEKIPDIQDEEGKDPDITKEEDYYAFYGKNNISIMKVVGHKKIFFFMKTEERDKLSQFIMENTEFVKNPLIQNKNERI
ncbi:MAG: hypothetical protein ACLFNK_00920 [Candidatus Woesearchaeota archaeon]